MIGCGSDDEEETTPAATVPTETIPEPVTTPPPETAPAGDKKPERDPDMEPRTVPEEEQQGDEEPIRSEAVFTGTGGRLSPRVVRVPPFIAVRVILRSTGDGGYTLTIGDRRLAIGGGRTTAEADLPGLLPNKSYPGTSPQGNVRIEATAEPGP
jgi:hypothetical protein